MSVIIGEVETFPNVRPDKAQALKPLEEASEIHGEWQKTCESKLGVSKCKHCNEKRTCTRYYMLVCEIADTIQACANVAAAIGISDMSKHMKNCEERNRTKGRFDADVQ